jgi:hypothetical protein
MGRLLLPPARRVLFGLACLLALSGLGLASPAGAEGVLQPRALAPSAAPSPVLAAAEPGPIPDFEPLGMVVTHDQVKPHAGELNRALDALLGPRHVVEHYDPCGAEPGVDCVRWPPDKMMMWARDYEPIYVRKADGRLKIVHYLSPNPNRSRYLEVAARKPGHPLRALVQAADGRPAPIVETMPLLHENGNLIANGRYVFISHRILEENTIVPPDKRLVDDGFARRTPEQIIAVLSQALERPASDIVVLPPLPQEQTGHVDMFLMALDRDTLIIPRIPREALDLTTPGMERDLGFETAVFLDHAAGVVQGLGLRVERLPMLPPVMTPSEDGVAGHVDPLYVTPTNGLLVRTRDKAAVLLPTFHVPPRGAAFNALRRDYEKEWTRFFKAHGWTPQFVDATEVAHRGGLFHCVTASIPP